MHAYILFLALAADTPSQPEKMVEHARELLGVPYDFGGRLKSGEGTDCQGVIFYAAERVQKCGWKSFSVMPTKTLRDKELGEPVKGLSPVASAELKIEKLKVGDILFFVGEDENPAEVAIAKLNKKDVWVWHTAMYSGKGKFIVGDHYAGKTVEIQLKAYLKDHADAYSGLYVLRMKEGPTPKKCRRHEKMKRVPGPGSRSARPG